MFGILRSIGQAISRRRDRRDFRLLKLYLRSPEFREKALQSASPAAQFLMLTLGGLANSDQQTAQVQFRYNCSDSILGDASLPPPMASQWFWLILSAISDAIGRDDECPFVYVSKNGTVPINAEHVLPKLRNLKLDDVESFRRGIHEEPETFIFTKKPPQ